MDSVPLGIIIVVLILFSAFFSATETAFSSVNKIRLKNLASANKSGAKLALKLSEDYNSVLSTILVGNNIVNILSTSLATIFFTNLFGDMGVTISTIVITIVVLFFAEVTPKSIAKDKAESFSCLSAPILQFFIWLFFPINLFFTGWKWVLKKVFKLESNDTFTEEELITIVDEVEEDGVLDEHESELIRSAIEFNDLDVEDIFIPRTELIAIEKNATTSEISNLFQEHSFSRMPVYDGNIDKIIGVLLEKDFVRAVLQGSFDIEKVIMPAIMVSSSMKILKLLRQLQFNKQHMAIVVDEYGGTMGICTMEDILEELVGEIWDESDDIAYDIEHLSDGSYKVSCNMNLDKMFETFGLEKHSSLHEDVTTVNGFVSKMVGDIPKVGDEFTYDKLQIKVIKAEFRKATEIIVNVIEDEEENL